MNVCLFGSYSKNSYGIPSGNGGTLLKKILEGEKINVTECHYEVKGFLWLITAYFSLFFKHFKIQYDVMIIPWRGILTLPLAKLIHKGPIIYFPAFSIYDTLVNDRKSVKHNSIKARLIHYVDKWACNVSDLIILESSEEIEYFKKEFNIQSSKFRQCPLGADESLFTPTTNRTNKDQFVVLYFGSFIPLHGVNSIVESAKNLQEYKKIIFRLCGDGQTRKEIEEFVSKNSLKNVEILGRVSTKKLLDEIHQSDICLGIFGGTWKARKVVTNKVLQILACKKPLITMSSPAIIESHLIDKKNCILVQPDSPIAISQAILELERNSELRELIAEKGYQTYKKYLSMAKVGEILANSINDLLMSQSKIISR